MYTICLLYTILFRVVCVSDGEVMLSARIPEELKQLIDADKRTNQEVVKAALWREFGGERVGALERRIEQKENRISLIKNEKNERERELRQEKEELDALEAKLEAVKTTEQDTLEKAMEKLERTPRDPDNPAIQKWAEKCGIAPETLVDKLVTTYDTD